MGDRGADMGTTLHQGQNRSLPNRPSHHRHQCKETPIARHDRMEITWNEDLRQNPTTGKQTKPSYILSTQNQSTKMDTWYHKTTIKQWKLTSKTGTPSGETQKSQDRVRWWIQCLWWQRERTQSRTWLQEDMSPHGIHCQTLRQTLCTTRCWSAHNRHPVDSVYPGVVILTFIAETNQMELWTTDIGSAWVRHWTISCWSHKASVGRSRRQTWRTFFILAVSGVTLLVERVPTMLIFKKINRNAAKSCNCESTKALVCRLWDHWKRLAAACLCQRSREILPLYPARRWQRWWRLTQK